jgi:sugar lactone lactonase YvrE
VTVDADGTIWAGGEAGQFYRVDPASGSFLEAASSGGFLLGVTADGGRYVYGCDIKLRGLVRLTVETGSVETVITSVEGRALVNPNYAAFDRAGRLYVTDSGHWLQNDGFLFVMEPDGTVRVLDERPCHFPNGLALDDEQGELYIAESTLPGVTKLVLADSGLETVAETDRSISVATAPTLSCVCRPRASPRAGPRCCSPTRTGPPSPRRPTWRLEAPTSAPCTSPRWAAGTSAWSSWTCQD